MSEHTEKLGVEKGKENRISPLRAIRLNCIECMGEHNPSKCEITHCKLWPFRLGKDPYRKKRELTEQQKERLKDTLKKAREAKNQSVYF